MKKSYRILSSMILIVFLIGLFPTEAFAYIGYEPGADIKQDPLINVQGLSSSSSGIQGTTSDTRFQTDFFTGAATYTYPFSLPLGRKKLTPPLALSYNSNSKNNFSLMGYGWELSQSFIERSDRLGVNHLYDDTNEFNINLFGSGGELVAETLVDDSHGEYVKKIESDFSIYEYNTDESWVVTTQDGTQYTFGETSASRQTDPDDSSRTYKWMLSEIRDLNDNPRLQLKVHHLNDSFLGLGA